MVGLGAGTTMTEEKAFLRMVEALLFAADEPLDEASLAARLPDGAEVPALLAALAERYADGGVNLVRVAGKWALRTAPDLKFLLERQVTMPRRLSRAAVETLAIIAYNQPVTRAEIEEIRGVGLSRGTLDLLLETGWVRLRGRRRSPGRPATWGTSEEFLEHFGLESVDDLPGLDELKAAGMLQAQPPRAILAAARAAAATQDDEDDEDEDTDDDADDTLIALDPS